MTLSWNSGEVLSNHKVLDSPLTSAEGLRFEGWDLLFRASGVGLRVEGGLRDKGVGFRVKGVRSRV